MKVYRKFSKRACNVCIAYTILEGKFSDLGYDFKAEGKAEFSPAKLWIRKTGEKEWGEPTLTMDLAGTVGQMGLDTKVPNGGFEKQKALLDAMYEGSRKNKLYCTYPRLEYVHKKVIWGED